MSNTCLGKFQKYTEKLPQFVVPWRSNIQITNICVGKGTYILSTHPDPPSIDELWRGNNNYLEIKKSVRITGQGNTTITGQGDTRIVGGFLIKNDEESNESGGPAKTHVILENLSLEGSLCCALDAKQGTSFHVNKVVVRGAKNCGINAVEGCVGTIENSQIFDCCKAGVCVEQDGKITLKKRFL